MKTLNKRKVIGLIFVATLILSVAFCFINFNQKAYADEEKSVTLSETKYSISKDGEHMLLVTGISDVDAIYEVGYDFGETYTVTGDDRAVTDGYYTSINIGTATLTASDIFGVAYPGMIVWEVAYDRMQEYTFNAYAYVGEIIEDKLYKQEPEAIIYSSGKTRPIIYHVTLNNDGATTLVEIASGNTVSASTYAVSKDGYTFCYWENDGEIWDESTVITEDVTLSAKWIPDISGNYSSSWTGITIASDGKSVTIPAAPGSYADVYIEPTSETTGNITFAWTNWGGNTDYGTYSYNGINYTITIGLTSSGQGGSITFTQPAPQELYDAFAGTYNPTSNWAGSGSQIILNSDGTMTFLPNELGTTGTWTLFPASATTGSVVLNLSSAWGGYSSFTGSYTLVGGKYYSFGIVLSPAGSDTKTYVQSAALQSAFAGTYNPTWNWAGGGSQIILNSDGTMSFLPNELGITGTWALFPASATTGTVILYLSTAWGGYSSFDGTYTFDGTKFSFTIYLAPAGNTFTYNQSV